MHILSEMDLKVQLVGMECSDSKAALANERPLLLHVSRTNETVWKKSTGRECTSGLAGPTEGYVGRAAPSSHAPELQGGRRLHTAAGGGPLLGAA